MPIGGETAGTRIGRTLYVSGGGCGGLGSDHLVQSFDLETATWSTLPPAPVIHSEAAVINGHLTLIGGFDPSTEKVTNQVWSWDEENKEWRNTIPSMPTPRRTAGVAQTSSVVAVYLVDVAVIGHSSAQLMSSTQPLFSGRHPLSSNSHIQCLD